MSQKLQKKSKKLAYLIASLFLALISFGGSIFSKGGSKIAYADAVTVTVVNTSTPNDGPCPTGGCCDTCVGDNDKIAKI